MMLWLIEDTLVIIGAIIELRKEEQAYLCRDIRVAITAITT